MHIENLCAKRISKISTQENITKGHEIALRGGYIHQFAGGLFGLSFLGQRVMRNICRIIRAEMDALDMQEISLPVISPAALWKQTGRFDTVDVLAKFKGRNGSDYVICPTHEELVTEFVKAQTDSVKQFPIKVYQIQTKYRDELRVRAGLIRTREFLMKDGYSFHTTLEDLQSYYAKVHAGYAKTFARLGFKNIVDIEGSCGDMGGLLAHEFSLIHSVGEDKLCICDSCGYKANGEILADEKCPRCRKGLRFERGIELGNIFQLGTKYTKALDFKAGTDYPIMGCYGIGVSRCFSALLEQNAGEDGIIWQADLAPFKLHIIGLNAKEAAVKEAAIRLYERFKDVAVLDVRESVSAGEQFSDADLIGAPYRVVVSKKTLAEDKVEFHDRAAGAVLKTEEGQIFRGL